MRRNLKGVWKLKNTHVVETDSTKITYFDFDGVNYLKREVLDKTTGHVYTQNEVFIQPNEFVTEPYKKERKQEKLNAKKGLVWVQVFKDNASNKLTGRVSFQAKGLLLELILCLNKGSGLVINPKTNVAFTPSSLAKYLNENTSTMQRWLNELESAGVIHLEKLNKSKKTSPQQIFVNNQVAFSGNELFSLEEKEYFNSKLEPKPIDWKVNNNPSIRKIRIK